MKQARRHSPTVRKPTRRGQEGVALVLALFATAALIATGTASLMIGTSDVNASRNYKGAAQVHLTAESGLSRALQAINDDGVVTYQGDVVNDWTNYLGTSWHQMAPLPGFTYRVTPALDAGDPAGRGRLVSSARGPDGLQSTVVANLSRLVLPFESPGVIYLAQDNPTNATFVGNAFFVDGNDYNMNGTPGPNPPVPGIATRNDTNTAETIASLNALQLDNVRGAGFSWGPPIIPSVRTSPSSPNVAQVNQIIATLLALPHTEFTDYRINGNFTFGTEASPQITHFTNEDGITIKGNGNAQGAGIMIVDNNLTIQGNFSFRGLILVGGSTTVQYDWETGLTGNALLLGSIWTTELNLKVGGSALALYSSQALTLADNLVPDWGMPAPMQVTSIVDCAQVYSGVAGCP
jgi:hypothetical protein